MAMAALVVCGVGLTGGEVALGVENGTAGTESIALKSSTSAMAHAGQKSVAIGDSASVGDESVAIGYGATVLNDGNAGDYGIAIGKEATAQEYGIGIGRATKSGTGGISIGDFAGQKGSGADSIKIGTSSAASGDSAISIGKYATSNYNYSIAIGENSKTLAQNAVAIGYNSVASEANTVSFGHKSTDTYLVNRKPVAYGTDSFARLTNVADGVADSDAATYGQLKAVKEKVEDVTTQVENVTNQVVDVMNNSLGTIRNDINKVGAGAAALAALRPEIFNPDDKWSFAVGYGHYKNANSGAFGAFYKPNADTTVSVGSTIGNGDPMMNVGVSFKIGARSKGAGIYSSNTELVREVNSLRKDNERYVKVINAQAERIASLETQVAQILKKLGLSGTVKKTATAH